MLHHGGRRWLSVSVLGAVIASLVATSNVASGTPTSSAATKPSPCQFQKANRPLNVALCETFDHPAGTGNRSGDLNGTLWGVSRETGHTNFGQGQYNASSHALMKKCGQMPTVISPHDVAICHGMAVEAVNDDHDVTALAMYPKQPFDIAGRTGTIAFDVSDDSQGTHAAWPELWYTDQPVPAPFTKSRQLQSVPRNGFGIRFAGSCPRHGSCDRSLCPKVPSTSGTITVSSVDVVNNYVSDDSDTNDNPPANNPIKVKIVGCVKASSGPGNLNHFEVRVSQKEIDIYGTDAGATTGPMTELAVVTHAPLTLTRGLVWMEDVHYNGNKFGTQGTHTFTWDNFGFDGPTLPRDLAFDVLDHLQPVGSYRNLGWPVGPTDIVPLIVVAPGVYNVVHAAGALLTLNTFTMVPVTLSYRVNTGAWHRQPWPFPPCNAGECNKKSLAMPVPLSEVQSGINIIQLKSTGQTAVSNIDLILVGAG
jgi:hypothetical protein